MISLPETFHCDDNVVRMKFGVRLAVQSEMSSQGQGRVDGFLPGAAQVK
jgi:hypothetical protein